VHHLADFVMALDSRKRFAPDFNDGVRIQAVLEAASKSATGHRWIPVAP
jgi:predicted dehydrogenase